MRTYYNECEYCGANLDPGEHCSCQDRQRPEPAPHEFDIDELNKSLKNVDTDLFFDLLSENYSAG